jgi:hypothetical protein
VLICEKLPDVPVRRYTLYPITFEEPSAFQLRLTLWAGAATPVPVSAPESGELEALLTNETLEEATPLDCGVKVMVKLALCPAAIVTGKESPLMENSELATSAAETTMLAPVALRVPVWEPVVPTTTLPTAIVEGLTLN